MSRNQSVAHRKPYNCIEISEADRVHRVNASNRILATKVIRVLRGSSRPILVHGSNGLFYVVKSVDSLQGPNVAFNECMGTELYRMCGLPCPAWAPIWLSNEFIDQNPTCWTVTPEGPRRPKAGWCFGSRFLGLQEAPLREVLSGSDFNRIRNRMDFWIARVLDSLCCHADNRQALFMADDTGWIDAYFIDHGHLFGGPHGASNPVMITSRYLDKRIYPTLSRTGWNEIEQTIAGIRRSDVLQAVKSLPDRWVTDSARAGLESSLARLSDRTLLRNLGQRLLDSGEDAVPVHGRKPPQSVPYERIRQHAMVSPIGTHGRTNRAAGAE